MFEHSLAYQGTLVNHNGGHATCWTCNVCAVTGLLEVGETVALRKLIEDLLNAPAQVTRGMAALAKGLRSGCTTLLGAASSAGFVSDAVSMPAVLAPGHMVSGQPGRKDGHGCRDHQHSIEGDRSIQHLWSGQATGRRMQ